MKAAAVDTVALAEALRESVGRFVRATRQRSGTPATAGSEVLAHLDRHGPMSMAALAEARGVKHQSMRLIVGRLQESALLELRANPHDGRGWLVALTARGRAAIRKDRAARTATLAHRIDAFSAKERATLRDAVALITRLGDPG